MTAAPAIDPITFTVIWNSIVSIAEELGTAKITNGVIDNRDLITTTNIILFCIG